MDIVEEIEELKNRVKALEDMMTMADFISGFKISAADKGFKGIIKRTIKNREDS